MSRLSRLIFSVILVGLIPGIAFAQEEPYSQGTVPNTAVSSEIDVVVLGLTVTFSVSGEGSCNWDFGDGESAAGNPVTHTYAAAGPYAVTATCAGRVFNVTAAVGPLTQTGAEVSGFLMWGGGMLLAGTAAVIYGRREEA